MAETRNDEVFWLAAVRSRARISDRKCCNGKMIYRLLGLALLRIPVTGNFSLLCDSRRNKFATQAKADFAANHRSQFKRFYRFRQRELKVYHLTEFEVVRRHHAHADFGDIKAPAMALALLAFSLVTQPYPHVDRYSYRTPLFWS